MRTLILAVGIILLAACSSVSSIPSIKPTPPEVDCRQPATPPLRKPPAAGEWLQWTPPSSKWPAGLARLSQRAVDWISEAVGAVDKERALRATEGACLDELERAGVIRQ